MEAILQGVAQANRTNAIPAHSRIITAFAVSCAIVLSHSLLAFSAYLLLTVLMSKQGSVKLVTSIKRLTMINGLVVLTIIPLPFSFVNEQVIQFGPLTLSEVGSLKAVEIYLKATLCSIVMISQCSGISELELSRALYVLRIPTRFILLLQFSIRYISVMQQELSRLKTAMRARGLGSGSMLHSWRSYGYLFGMLFVKALDRADRIWLAMKCRGYSGHFPNTTGIRDSKLVTRSSLFYIVLALLLLTADMLTILPGYHFGLHIE